MSNRAFVLFFTSIVSLVFLFAALPLCAAEWDEAPGVIVYYDDNGQLVTRNFRYFLTAKHAFFHYHNGSRRVRMHIRHPEKILLNGNNRPIEIVLRNGDTILGTLDEPFVKELTGLEEFTFRANNPVVERLNTYTVPAEAIKSMSFR